MLSMPVMKMDAVAASSHNNVAHESADDSSNTSCCDAITPCLVGVDFLVPQLVSIASMGDSKRVGSLAPIVQSIYLSTLSPPPKA